MLENAGYFVGYTRKGWGPGRIEPGGRSRNPAGEEYQDFATFLAERPADRPFSFWFGSSDPHRDYEEGSGAASGMDLDAIILAEHFPDSPEVRGDVADYYWEVQRFDREVGELLEMLERAGELENTVVVMTGDHGMPFPRCKGNLYDCGARVPLAIRWPGVVRGCRSVDGFVSLTDLAPTFLGIASIDPPPVMTGTSLIEILRGSENGPEHDHVLIGKERHVPCQEAPESGGTPMRAIRTRDYLYIRNFEPDRWPAGTPDYENATLEGSWYGDVDNGPTKTYMIANRGRDPEHRKLFEIAFGKRPAEELYDVRNDPGQLENVAAAPAYANAKNKLSEALDEALAASGDPRVADEGDRFDGYPYFMGPDPPRHVDWEQLGKPAELDGLFRKALAKDVDERFGSGAELIDALRALSASAADRESPSATVVLVPPAAETPEPLDPKKLKSVREEERALELSPRFSDVVQAVMLTPEEGFVLSRIDGSTSIPRDILSVSPLDEENTTRVLLGMLEKDLIRFRDAETKPKIAPTEKPSSGASGEVKKEDAAETALLKEVEALIAVGKDDPAKILGVDEGADITQIKKAYRERVLRYHPDRHSVVANPDLRDRLSHLLALVTEAFGVMSERREKADAVRNAPPVRVASPHPEITPTGSTTALGDETDEFDNEEHAHELFRHAEKAFELQDHWQTIQLCRQAVELYDKEAKFHHLLGVALVRNKKWRKEAAQSFGRAIELEEKNPHYLGLLAAVYKAEGLQLRADKIFNQLLKIDPSYEIPELPA